MKIYFFVIMFVLLTAITAYANNNFQFHYNEQRPGGDYTSFDVSNVDECAMECERDRRCQAFDFDTYEQQCFLKDRVPKSTHNRDVISGVKHQSGNKNQRVPKKIAGLHIENNTKRNGGDYTNFVVGNVEECAQACSRDNKCQSFNYGKKRRDCWLKSNVPNGTQNDTVISGVKAQHASGKSDKKRQGYMVGSVRLEPNTKRNGGDYKNFTVGTLEECARACDKDNRCQSFNYGKKHRDCWLKHGVPNGFHNDTVVSGVKER